MELRIYPVGDQVLPVEASMSGKNAYYVSCEQRGCRQNYGVCRFFINKKNEGKLPENSFSDCSSAYDKNQCPAKKLHQEEIEAGRALYFVPRAEPIKMTTEDRVVVEKKTSVDRGSDSYKRGWSRLDGIPSKVDMTKRAAPKPPKSAEPDKSDFERLVNDLSKEDKVKKTAVNTIPTKERILPLPGETPLEFARRRMSLLKKG